MMKNLLLFFWRVFVFGILFIVQVSFSFSQTISFFGRVIDAATRQPIVQAIVSLHESHQQVSTNDEGYFDFKHLKNGQYTLSIHHIAYASIDRRMTRISAQNDTLIIEMQSALLPSKEVIVRSTRTALDSKKTPYPIEVVADDRLIDNPALTVSDALSRIPGIALVRDGMWQTAVSIRGMSRSNIVMEVDNTRIETANVQAAALSLVNPYDLERIEVVKGSNSTLQGTGAFGGIVHMISKIPSFSDQPHVVGEAMTRYESVNTMSANYVALESGSEILRMRVSGMYRKADNYSAPGGEVPNSQFMDFGFSAMAGIKLFDSHFLNFTYQRFQAENAGMQGGGFADTALVKYSLARRELYKAEYSMPNISNILSQVTIRASQQSIERHVQINQSPSHPELLVITPHAIHTTDLFQTEIKVIPSDDNLLTSGIEIWQRSLDSKREMTNSRANTFLKESPLPNSSCISAGIYLQDEWQIIPKTTSLVTGGRYDFIRLHNDLTYDTLFFTKNNIVLTPINQSVFWDAKTSESKNWSMNAGVHQTITHALDASIFISNAFRVPTLEELFLYQNNGGQIHYGNPDLLPEKSISIDGGLQAHTALWDCSADVYYTTITDRITERYDTLRIIPALVQTNIGSARIYGYEVSADVSISSSLVFHSTLACVRGEDTKNHANLPQISPLEGSAFIDYLLQNIGTIHFRCDVTADQNLILPGTDMRTPGHTVYDINFVSTPQIFAGTNITVRAGIQNIFDKAYRNHLSTLRGNMKDEPGRNYYLSANVAF
jgi:hemoglobin/transferrin/lactoferrin receptor protein